MLKVKPPRYERRQVTLFLTALLVVVADQLSKIGIMSGLATGASFPATGLFRLTHVRNTGAAFGLFQDQSFSLTIVGLIGIVVLLLFVFFFTRRLAFFDNRLGKPALGLILGGIVGNLIDRLRLGYVTDFIDIGIWPVFNLADSSITVGVILLAYCLLFLTRANKH